MSPPRQAITTGQSVVKDDQSRMMLPRDLDGLDAVNCSDRFKAEVDEIFTEKDARVLVVVNDQDLHKCSFIRSSRCCSRYTYDRAWNRRSQR